MNPVDYLHIAALAMAAVAALLAIYRMAVGPWLLDRIVANDVLAAVAVTITSIIVVWWQRFDLGLVLLLLALTGFVSSVVAARFVIREVVGDRKILSREEAERQQRQREEQARSIAQRENEDVDVAVEDGVSEPVEAFDTAFEGRQST